MVRLKDIAQAAGVTPGTVSAALGGIGRVSPETREAIRKLAVEMDYRPSSAARVLRNKPTVDAGMLIADGLRFGFSHLKPFVAVVACATMS